MKSTPLRTSKLISNPFSGDFYVFDEKMNVLYLLQDSGTLALEFYNSVGDMLHDYLCTSIENHHSLDSHNYWHSVY